MPRLSDTITCVVSVATCSFFHYQMLKVWNWITGCILQPSPSFRPSYLHSREQEWFRPPKKMGTRFKKLISSNISEESLITNCPSSKQAFTLWRSRENGINGNKQIRSSSYRWPFSSLLLLTLYYNDLSIVSWKVETVSYCYPVTIMVLGPKAGVQ